MAMSFKDFIGPLITGVLVGVLVTLVAVATMPPQSPPKLTIHTDPQTGCQYLAAPGGGITPRLDASGRPVCSPVGRQMPSVGVL